MHELTPILTDICWTLYRSNTTFDFLDAVIEADGYRRLRRIARHPIVRLINLLILRLTHRDMIRHWALRYLRTYSDEQIAELARQFVRQDLSGKKIDAAWEVLRGRRIVLVSGTIPPIAQAVAEEVGAVAVYAGDIHKRKVQSLYDTYDIITDNRSDIALVRRARHATIVTYGNQNWWQNVLGTKEVDYIEGQTERY